MRLLVYNMEDKITILIRETILTFGKLQSTARETDQ